MKLSFQNVKIEEILASDFIQQQLQRKQRIGHEPKKFRNGSEHAYVYVYEIEIPENLNIKKYDGLTVEWLDLIKINRSQGGIQNDYDIVIGPVANDDTRVTVARYMDGTYSAEEAIKRLRYSKTNDQVAFHTKRSFQHLNFQRRYSVD